MSAHSTATSGARRTYWDQKIGANATIVLPGEHLVSAEPDLALVTLLGSCVAACIRDKTLGIGGLNHFLLPEDHSGGGEAGAGSLRYGANAMEVLVNDILRRGGSKGRLEAKVFGGGNVIDVSSAETVGARNAKFVREYLRREGIEIAAQDLGGNQARRVFYFPSTGRAAVLRLESAEQRAVREEELRFKARISKAPTAGSVELFV